MKKRKRKHGSIGLGNGRGTGSENSGAVSAYQKGRSISQQRLAEMSGVSYGSIKRFESKGRISLLSLTRLAIALDAVDDLRNLFTQVPYRSIQEVINEGRQCASGEME